jgi:hypothetical protein
MEDDWQPQAAESQFAQDLGLDPAAVRDQFVDYWIARPGAGGTKLDWPATWRNWCRRADGRDRGVGGAQARTHQTARGHGAFYDELARIARSG